MRIMIGMCLLRIEGWCGWEVGSQKPGEVVRMVG